MLHINKEIIHHGGYGAGTYTIIYPSTPEQDAIESHVGI